MDGEIVVTTEAGTVVAEHRRLWALVLEAVLLQYPPGGDWRLTYVTRDGRRRPLTVTGSRYQAEQDARAWARRVDDLGEMAFLRRVGTWRCRLRLWWGAGPAAID